MRILVTGKHGQVVQALVQRGVETSIEIQTLARPDMEMADPVQTLQVMQSAIAAFKPTLIVNAAAYTAVDQAEDEPELAHAINAASAGAIARAAFEAGLPIIQISTDYVFDGTKDSAYIETDAPNPQGVYGASKLAGEQAVAAANPQHLILRTAWVYSPFGKNFVKTMLRLAETKPEISVVADQTGNPTSAFDIADGILAAARRYQADPATMPWGTYHLAGTGATNWAGFAEEIFKLSAKRGGPTASVKNITTADYPTKAKRPANSVLASAAFEQAFGWQAQAWQGGMEEVLNAIRPEPLLTAPLETTEPVQPPKRTCILVLGMHRSGTSALARVLNLMGAALPVQIIGAGPGNETGHWEPERLVLYHEHLLAELGSSWHDWLPLDFTKLSPERREQIKIEIADIIKEEYQDEPLIVIKDPRICRFPAFFAECVNDAGYQVKTVFIFRNPLEVIDSLLARENNWPEFYSRTNAALLWLTHNLKSIAIRDKSSSSFVLYNELLTDWRTTISKIEKNCRLILPFSIIDSGKTIDEFLKLELRHYDHQENITLLAADDVSWVDQTWKALAIAATEGFENGAGVTLAEIDKEFSSAVPNLGNVLETITVNPEASEQNFKTLKNLAELDIFKANQKYITTKGQLDEIKSKFEILNLKAQVDDLNANEKIRLADIDLAQKNTELANISAALEQSRIEADAIYVSLTNYSNTNVELERKIKLISDGHSASIKNLSNIIHQKDKEIKQLKFPINNVTDEYKNLLKRFISGVSVRVFRFLSIIYVFFFPLMRKRQFVHDAILSISPRYHAYLKRKFNQFENGITYISKPEIALSTQSSSNNSVLFSFVIPIFDRTDILVEAIESVLAQTFQSFELILVADGSPAETVAVIRSYAQNPKVRCFFYPTSSGNAVRGRNKGILEARGEYVSFLDSDDIATPDRLDITKRIFDQTNCDVVYGAWRAKLDGTRNVEGLRDGQIIVSPQCEPDDLYETCVPCQSTVTVRKSCLQKYGYLKPKMKYREDHELWARLAFHGAIFKSTPQILTELRIHKGNNELNFKNDDNHWKQLFSHEYKRAAPHILKIVFVVGSLGISGGLLMIIRHAEALCKDGHDVSIVNLGAIAEISEWIPGCVLPIIHLASGGSADLLQNLDIAVATFWTTVNVTVSMNAKRTVYFVQSDERLFYGSDADKNEVSKTYQYNLEFIVVAQWIKDFLKTDFNQDSVLINNGINLDIFNFKHRNNLIRNSERKIVLIEGPIGISWKGVEDAYKAVCDLPVDIWLVTPDFAPPKAWKIAKHFLAVTQAEMVDIYSSCDVFLKLSQVESFCLPVLEAMACGCATVVGDVSGGIDYLEDNYNCLKVPKHDIQAARIAVIKILNDQDLFERLISGGKSTAERYNITSSYKQMKDFMECEQIKRIKYAEATAK